ncbi:hypothetical protein JQX08_17775 [Pseudomonas sp. UL073]|uniref:Uncharacterized protein n=1 Tax=Zestomonas insulae TaxID=2809017 RepID=A0ABS2IHL8_9GAMM|nr:hypothetical protein [Pseudomonas insulae]MBM7062566.1 hypothetical protein [Pseudomonas insulae]
MTTVRQISLLSLCCAATLWFSGVHAEERVGHGVAVQTADLTFDGFASDAVVTRSQPSAQAKTAQQPHQLEAQAPRANSPANGLWLRTGDDTETALQQPRSPRWVF